MTNKHSYLYLYVVVVVNQLWLINTEYLLFVYCLQGKIRCRPSGRSQENGRSLCREISSTPSARPMHPARNRPWNRRPNSVLRLQTHCKAERCARIENGNRSDSGTVSTFIYFFASVLFSLECHQYSLICIFHIRRATGGELQAILDEDGSLSEVQAQLCMREILHALQHLHTKRIAHLDIKPQNILLCGDKVEGA